MGDRLAAYVLRAEIIRRCNGRGATEESDACTQKRRLRCAIEKGIAIDEPNDEEMKNIMSSNERKSQYAENGRHEKIQ